MPPSCDDCVLSLANALKSILGEYNGNVDVDIVECVDEEGLKMLFKSRYEQIDRLLVPDAAAPIEVKSVWQASSQGSCGC